MDGLLSTTVMTPVTIGDAVCISTVIARVHTRVRHLKCRVRHPASPELIFPLF
jgi:hypothetical protein